jgi:serine/threonine-protein kinase
VGDFWIMRTEVTNAQYQRCVEAGECTVPANVRYGQPQFARQPVTDVDWTQANAYARWAGGRLPTEAEWEKACRGADARIYPWGGEPPGPDLLNYRDSRLNMVNEVASYPSGASPYGVLDMAGNVWEWTGSLWGEDGHEATFGYPYDAQDGREDQMAPSTMKRVLRGGAFGRGAGNVRCAARGGYPPDYRYWDLGFRVVMPDLPEGGNRPSNP